MLGSLVDLFPRLSVWVRSPKGQRVVRWLMAGPGAVAATFAVTIGMPLWVPPGDAGIDQLVLPLFLMPLVWGALFFYACLDRSLMRVASIIFALCLVNGIAVVRHLADIEPPSVSRTVR